MLVPDRETCKEENLALGWDCSFLGRHRLGQCLCREEPWRDLVPPFPDDWHPGLLLCILCLSSAMGTFSECPRREVVAWKGTGQTRWIQMEAIVGHKLDIIRGLSGWPRSCCKQRCLDKVT